MNSEEEMKVFAEAYISTLIPKDQYATIVGLSGDLGSGKTTFTKSLAEALGISEPVLSPTFILAKYYTIDGNKWDELVHIDAYRIEDADEITVLRWDEIIVNPKKLIIVEWPEQLGKHFPSFASTLKFNFINDHTRTITLKS